MQSLYTVRDDIQAGCVWMRGISANRPNHKGEQQPGNSPGMLFLRLSENRGAYYGLSRRIWHIGRRATAVQRLCCVSEMHGCVWRRWVSMVSPCLLDDICGRLFCVRPAVFAKGRLAKRRHLLCRPQKRPRKAVQAGRLRWRNRPCPLYSNEGRTLLAETREEPRANVPIHPLWFP